MDRRDFARMHNDYLDPDRHGPQEGPCEVCGRAVDFCVCPVCPVCGEQGAPACYKAGRRRHLEINAEQIAGRLELEAAYDREEAELAAYWEEMQEERRAAAEWRRVEGVR